MTSTESRLPRVSKSAYRHIHLSIQPKTIELTYGLRCDDGERLGKMRAQRRAENSQKEEEEVNNKREIFRDTLTEPITSVTRATI